MTKYLIVLVLMLSSHFARAYAFDGSNGEVVVESLALPPFISDNMPEQGAAVYALTQIFKKMGYDLKVLIVPILRIRTLRFRSPNVSGFFPSFADDDFVDGLDLSTIIYETPWVIIERKDRPIVWKEAKDLAKYRGGNVKGYTIRSQVRKIYDESRLKLEAAPDDASNLLKLANKRIDYVFTDAHIFKYLMATDPRLKEFADKLQINPKIVAMNRYGVAFKRDPANVKLRELFNKTVTEPDFEKYVLEYFKKFNPS